MPKFLASGNRVRRTLLEEYLIQDSLVQARAYLPSLILSLAVTSLVVESDDVLRLYLRLYLLVGDD